LKCQTNIAESAAVSKYHMQSVQNVEVKFKKFVFRVGKEP